MRKDLIEAYVGRREDDHEFKARYETYVALHVEKGWAPPDYDSWMIEQVVPLIEQATPEARLEEYLEWNGIIGYTRSIVSIMKGEL